MNSHDAHGGHHRAVLVLPHVRIQNANAISSPMTWGFPAISAFTGFMTALERRLGRGSGIRLFRIGVICHQWDAQATDGDFTRAFHLTMNPLRYDGGTAGIIEEGRIHLNVTLVFDADVDDAHRSEEPRASLAARIAEVVAGMRLAGGSVLPEAKQDRQPILDLVPDANATEELRKQYRRLARSWMPGYALVSRIDVLKERLRALRDERPEATVFDAWLDLTRLTSRATRPAELLDDDRSTPVEWRTDRRRGWLVPIPVGYAALSSLYHGGVVRNARDENTPFRFVETIWSIGQWLSPHRLRSIDDLMWQTQYLPDDEWQATGAVYRCVNNYAAIPTESPCAD